MSVRAEPKDGLEAEPSGAEFEAEPKKGVRLKFSRSHITQAGVGVGGLVYGCPPI